VGGKGNQGVAEAVRANEYSIGYVELSYAAAAGLPVALIMNPLGEFVAPSPESVEAAARAAAGRLPSSPLDDWSGALEALVYAEGPGAYPIVSFTFLILWAEYPPEKAEAIASFLEWIAARGHMHLVEGYVAVPEELRRVALEAAEVIRGGAGQA
jgi:phosphate transport system substrate-binding protein